MSASSLTERILDATQEPDRGEDESPRAFIMRLIGGLDELPGDEWKALDNDVLRWAQDAIAAVETPGKERWSDVPELDGLKAIDDGVKEEPPPRPRLRRQAEPEPEPEPVAEKAPRERARRAAPEPEPEPEPQPEPRRRRARAEPETPAAAEPARRTRTKAEPEPAKEPEPVTERRRGRPPGSGGTGLLYSVFEIVAQNPDASLEKIADLAEDAKLEFKDDKQVMNPARQAQNFIKVLRRLGLFVEPKKR